MDLFELLDWKALIIAGVITSIVFSAFATQITIKKRDLVLGIVALVITMLNITFTVPTEAQEKIAFWQQLLLSLFLTWSFAVLFYKMVGKFTVKLIFEKIKLKIQSPK